MIVELDLSADEGNVEIPRVGNKLIKEVSHFCLEDKYYIHLQIFQYALT